MYYFSKQAGRFKDYCVVWFDINLLSVCNTSDHVETAHLYKDSCSFEWTLSSNLFTITYFNED